MSRFAIQSVLGLALAVALTPGGAAPYEDARRGRLGSASAPDLAGNATQRCEAQPAADRAACVQRILGAGSTQGGVEGGGLLQQTTTK